MLWRVLNLFIRNSLGLNITKSNIRQGNKVAKKIFKNCVIKKSDEGYFYLNPMPSESELDTYYSTSYWGFINGDKKFGANVRDLIHYQLLKTLIPDFFSDTENKVVLNFGAGHGGISHLLWFDGFTVINVEPSRLPEFYNSRWQKSTFGEIADNSVDLIYGSHSIEHVQDIDAFKDVVRRILRPQGYLFWETPNALNPNNGGSTNQIIIPHTYYFLKEFFDNWFGKVILNEAYDQNKAIEKWMDSKNEYGAVIRALGQLD